MTTEQRGAATSEDLSLAFLGLPRSLGFRFLLAFGCALVAYLTLWPQAPIRQADTPGYLGLAEDLKDFSIDQPTIRTPGYPLLLLATHSTPVPGKTLFITGLALHFASIWLLCIVLRDTGLSDAMLTVFLLVALLPVFVQNAALILTENLTQFLLAAVVGSFYWGVTRNRFALLLVASLLSAMLALTRPSYQLIAVVLAAGMTMGEVGASPRLRLRRRVLESCAVLLLCAAVLIGYSAYYYRKFGYFGITYQAGLNLCDKTARFVERLPSSYEPLRSYLIQARDNALVRGQSHTAEQYPWDQRLVDQSGQSQVQLAKTLLRANVELIVSNPLHYTSSVLVAMATLFMPYHTTLLFGSSKALQGSWAVMHFAWLAAFFLQFIVVAGVEVRTLAEKVVAALRRREWADSGERIPWQSRVAYNCLLGMIVYTLVISAMFDTGNSRYRSPADLLFLANLMLGCHIWANYLQARPSLGKPFPR